MRLVRVEPRSQPEREGQRNETKNESGTTLRVVKCPASGNEIEL